MSSDVSFNGNSTQNDVSFNGNSTQNEEKLRGLIAAMRGCFETPNGTTVLKYLEGACGWYESVYTPADRDLVLLNAGRREVLATIKTFLEKSPEEVMLLFKNLDT